MLRAFRRPALGVFLILLAASTLKAETVPLPDGLDRRIIQGIDDVFSMEFDASAKQYDLAIEEFPEHPYGYFGKAATEWLRYMYATEQSQTGFVKVFEKNVDLAYQKSQSWLAAHPGDAHILLGLGGIYGLKSRWSMVQWHWISAYLNGRKAIQYIRRAQEADAGLYDAYLGVGMYDYYSDSLPRAIKILSKILLIRGDRERGLEEIRMAADKGHFTKIAAKLVLIEIYTEDLWGGKNPKEAVRLVAEVRQKYPASPLWMSTEIVCLYEAGDFNALLPAALAYLEAVKAHWQKYHEAMLSKAHVAVGTAYWALGKKEHAMAAFRDGDPGRATSGRPSVEASHPETV